MSPCSVSAVQEPVSLPVSYSDLQNGVSMICWGKQLGTDRQHGYKDVLCDPGWQEVTQPRTPHGAHKACATHGTHRWRFRDITGQQHGAASCDALQHRDAGGVPCATGEVMLQAAGHCLGCPGK